MTFLLQLLTSKFVWLVIIVGCVSAYIWYASVRVDQLSKENTTLKQVIVEQSATIEMLSKSAEQVKVVYKNYCDLVINNAKALNNLQFTFTKNGRDLALLAWKKPGMIEQRINQAVDKRLVCLERATGYKRKDLDDEKTLRMCGFPAGY